MAKIRGSKEGALHDPSISMPTEQKTSESNKQKIAKIHEIFPDATKDHIAKILQYYEDDENQAMDAITRDGGCEALSNWAESGSLKSRNNKNKKKKKKSKRDAGAGMTATASFDADDSSSLHSGGNIDNEIEKECPKTENGILTNVDESEDRTSYSDHLASSNTNQLITQFGEPEKEVASNKLETFEAPPASPDESIPSESLSSSCDKPMEENSNPPSPDATDKQEDQGMKKEKYRSINEHSRNSPRRRTSSFRRNKTPSMSDDSSSHHNQQPNAANTTRGYDRCRKDLNRQTVSLQRINSQLEKGFEESEKKCKKAFGEYIKLMENRQKDVEAELAKTKMEAFNLLKSRQDLAIELKRRVDRAPTISEGDWTELRSDIKQFVTERKYDDDLGKTIWFHWSDLSDAINQFGEVQPVKNVYSQRSHSSAGKASNNPEPSPSSSLANEEIESISGKNSESVSHDVANMADAVEDGTHSTGKDEIPHFNKNQGNENRTSRVFSNSTKRYDTYGNHGRYNNNNRGGPANRNFRGNRGGVQRGNFRGNYYHQNNRNIYEDYNRNNPHPDREGQSFSDRNLRDNKGGRNFVKRGNYNQNYRFNRYNRGGNNAGGYQHNVAGASATEPPANSTAATSEKTVVNGFVENN